MLHGTVQSKLLALWFRLGDYEERWSRSDVESAELAAIREEIERISEQDVRRASHLLHPSIIRFGLVPAIRDLADARAKSFEVELVASPALIALDSVGGAGIAEELRLVAYRVVEEALNNAAKHAKARRVTITLDANEGALQVAVGDDGEGFQLGQVRPGLGLDSIGGRIDQLHGLLRIESVPQQGTRLLVTLPLEGGPHANPPADGALMGRSHSSIVSITSKPTER
ncbi:MAG: hypothetical protein KGJ86_23365, partial [Chloroflexota bacterium]|nr:hypothetical protein [Chloroflexota bacterium]